jgi:ATP-dependent DNA ligase
MADTPDPRAVAAAWLPELPGRVAPRDLPDAIVEPDWGGLRCVAAIVGDTAVIYRYGDELDVPAELLGSLTFAFNAVDAVVEGHLTTAAFEDGIGAFPATEHVDRPIFAVPSIFKRRNADPYIYARAHEARRESEAPGVLDALEAGEPHAFVAVDLLWLDGQDLADVPLLERKRLLDTVLRPSKLVRVTPFVRPASAPRTLITWATLGFTDLSWRAANARYLAGRENPGWAVAPAPMSVSTPRR